MPAEIKARPTLYKGIRMRSRLEADYAGRLDEWGYNWAYEPECFAGDSRQWVPDFHEWTFREDGGLARDAWVEIKPASLLDREQGVDHYARIDEILTRMTVAWLSKPDAFLELVFWTYREPRAVMRICGENGGPWWVSGLHPGLHLLWSGMNQFDSLDRRWELARER